jgi:hypothetical protein
MSKKNYDVSKIQNELKGASAFFKKPAASADNAPAQSEPIPAPPISAAKPAPSQTDTRTGVRPVRPVRPKRRQMIRHPFELYQDQVESLRHIAADDRLNGGQGSMSAMVRQAIDRLIDEHSSTQN